MKITLLYPPIDDPTMPYHGNAYLLGSLRANGFSDASARDINIEFVSYCLEEEIVARFHGERKTRLARFATRTELSFAEQEEFFLLWRYKPMRASELTMAVQRLRHKESFLDYEWYTASVGLLLLPLWDSGRQLRWIAIASLVVAVGAGTAGALAPPYSVDAPMPLNLIYVQDSPNKAQWLFGVGGADVPKVSGLLRAAPFSLEARPEGILPWLAGVHVPIYVAPAAPMPSALPGMRILDRQHTATGNCTRALVTAAPEAAKVILDFPPASTPRSLNIAGTELADPSQAGNSGGWHRYATTNPPEGTVVRFCLADGAANDLYLVAETYGLPEEGARLLAARPAFASASQDGNLTLRLRRVELSGAPNGD